MVNHVTSNTYVSLASQTTQKGATRVVWHISMRTSSVHCGSRI